MIRVTMVAKLLLVALWPIALASATTAHGAAAAGKSPAPQKPAAEEKAATQPKTLGAFGSWTAVVDSSGKRRVCYIGSAPKKTEGKYSARGPTHLLVTHRPADKVKGEVSVSTGYAYKDGKDAEAEINGRKFKLFTRGENAWTYDAAADRALVAAMKNGNQLVVHGTSARGTQTTDTYSLSGFSAALAAIDKACESK
jgi:invasion protein IalB